MTSGARHRGPAYWITSAYIGNPALLKIGKEQSPDRLVLKTDLVKTVPLLLVDSMKVPLYFTQRIW